MKTGLKKRKKEKIRKQIGINAEKERKYKIKKKKIYKKRNEKKKI